MAAKFSAKEIAELKAKHGDILHLVKADGKECIIKEPSRKTLSFARVGANNDPIVFNEILLKECFVDGDEDFKSRNDLFYAVTEKLASLVKVAEAEMEKL